MTSFEVSGKRFSVLQSHGTYLPAGQISKDEVSIDTTALASFLSELQHHVIGFARCSPTSDGNLKDHISQVDLTILRSCPQSNDAFGMIVRDRIEFIAFALSDCEAGWTEVQINVKTNGPCAKGYEGSHDDEDPLSALQDVSSISFLTAIEKFPTDVIFVACVSKVLPVLNHKIVRSVFFCRMS